MKEGVCLFVLISNINSVSQKLNRPCCGIVQNRPCCDSRLKYLQEKTFAPRKGQCFSLLAHIHFLKAEKSQHKHCLRMISSLFNESLAAF